MNIDILIDLDHQSGREAWSRVCHGLVMMGPEATQA